MDKQRIQLYASLIKLIERSLDKKEAAELDKLLQNSHEARRLYCEFMKEYLLTKELVSEIALSAKVSLHVNAFDSRMWQELASYEQTASPAPVIKATEPQPCVRRVEPVPVTRRPRKRSFLRIAASIAALVVFFAYVKFMPANRPEICAVLADSLNAKWQTAAVGKGSNILSSKDYHPVSGTVKLKFSYGAEVIVEGPSSFSCRTPEVFEAEFGKFHILCPAPTAGFTVDTPTSRIVDLGTQFGVYVSQSGTTDVHMIKGRAALFPGLKGHKGDAVNIEEGDAARLSSDGQIESIQFKEDVFVRQFISSDGYVWRGEQLPQIEGLVIHLRADTLNLHDGEPVASWSDSAVADAVNGTVNRLDGYGVPVFVKSACNELPAVRFTRPPRPSACADSLKEVLVSGQWQWNPSNGLTVFTVCTGGRPNFAQRAVQIGDAEGETYRSFACDVSAGQSGSRDNNGYSLADSPFKTGQWHAGVRQIRQGGKYSSLFYSVNGVSGLAVSTNQDDRKINFARAGNIVSLGNGPWHAAEWPPLDWYDGDIAEVLVYNAQLTKEQRRSVMNYLLSKYNLTGEQHIQAGQ